MTQHRRSPAAVISALASVLGCTEPTPEPPTGTFQLVSCAHGNEQAYSPPCANGRASKYSHYVDSSRMVFNGERVVWTLWSRTDWFYLYYPGDTTPWSTRATVVIDTMYEVVGDSLRIGGGSYGFVMAWQPSSALQWPTPHVVGTFFKKP